MAKVFIEESTLTAIGDVIRTHEGHEDLVPVTEMSGRLDTIINDAAAGETTDLQWLEVTENGTYTPDGFDGWYEVQVNVPTGGNTEEYFSDEDLIFTGYLPANTLNGAISGKVLQKELDRIKFNNIATARYLFNDVGQLDLSSMTISLDNADFTAMFSGSSVTALPKLTGSISVAQQYPFGNCYNLRYLPEGMDTLDYSVLHEYSGWMESFFYNCPSLREIPTTVLSQLWNKGTSYILYKQGFDSCYALDELVGIPVYETLEHSNQFQDTFYRCYRLKEVTFETNPDGTAKTANWTKQTINLSLVGLTLNPSSILDYNSGITSDKFVSDDETYQMLKDDPDWCACSRGHARYAYNSAVATINSLPDTSAYIAANGGTNTIKFSRQGESTDSGAINEETMVEASALAATKGWTVAFTND